MHAVHRYIRGCFNIEMSIIAAFILRLTIPTQDLDALFHWQALTSFAKHFAKQFNFDKNSFSLLRSLMNLKNK